MVTIAQDIEILAALSAKLEPDRWDSAIVNDLFEAAENSKQFGQSLLDDRGYDIPGRVQMEIELLDDIRSYYGAELEENPDYVSVMEAVERMIAAGKRYKPPPDGYLGSEKIVRETFAFLQSEFGLAPGPYAGMDWDYASDRVCVHLALATEFGSKCRIAQASDPSTDYYLEDLLFMGGRSVSLALPPGQAITTEADVQAWFTTVADVLRQYGSDVLADRPGAFERLAKAAAERERLYVEECERLYGSGASTLWTGEEGNGHHTAVEVMMQDVDALAALMAKFEPGRNDDGLVNDMFEAAMDWRSFAQMMLELRAEDGWDVSGRLQQEEDLFDELQVFYGAKLQENPDYAALMNIGKRLIATGKQRKPHPDGPLRSNKIIRQTFAFLQSEFGLNPGQAPDSKWDYASDRVCVHLELATEFDSWCQVKQASDPSFGYSLEDLLFMGGRSVSLALPPGQAITTEADVQAWFTTVADVLRQYGSDVLADRPGAFERLAEAAAERARLYVEECERLYGSGAH